MGFLSFFLFLSFSLSRLENTRVRIVAIQAFSLEIFVGNQIRKPEVFVHASWVSGAPRRNTRAPPLPPHRVRQQSRASPCPAPCAPAEGTSRAGCQQPQQHFPPAASAGVCSRGAGARLSSALRARVHAGLPANPPRPRAPCSPRPRAPLRLAKCPRPPPARTLLTARPVRLKPQHRCPRH